MMDGDDVYREESNQRIPVHTSYTLPTAVMPYAAVQHTTGTTTQS